MQMVISRRAVRDGLVAVAVVGSMALGAVGCAGGDDKAPKAGGEFVAGTLLCGGEAVSTEAAESLKVITGASRFEESDEDSTVVHAAKQLSQEFASSVTGDGDICQVFAIDAAQSDRLEVTWELTGGPPEGEPAPKFTVLRMGSARWPPRTPVSSSSPAETRSCSAPSPLTLMSAWSAGRPRNPRATRRS